MLLWDELKKEPFGVSYRILMAPIVFPLVYGGALLLKVGMLLCWWKWEEVEIGGGQIW